MLLKIAVQPRPEVTHFDTVLSLDRERWLFSFYTNSFDDSWYFDVREPDRTPVALGLSLSVGTDLLFPYRHLHVPPGALFLLDHQRSGRDPRVNDFAEELYDLVYWPVEGRA